MATTITSKGYQGPITGAEYAGMASRVGSSLYGVNLGSLSVGTLAPSIGVGTRQVALATGEAWGAGVYDTVSSVDAVSLASVSSGSRWDLVVLRRNWSTKATTVAVVAGGSAPTIPAPPARNVGPGVIDDQPICLARVTAGLTAVQEIIDLRVFPGDNGLLVAKDILALSYMNRVGTEVLVGDMTYVRALDAVGASVWLSAPTVDTGWKPLSLATKFVAAPGYPPQVRKVGKLVTLSGAVQMQAGAAPQTLIATAPSGYRPSRNSFLGFFRSNLGGYQGQLSINADGKISASSLYSTGAISVGGFIPLTGSWFID